MLVEFSRRAPSHRQLTRDDRWAISRKLLMAVWGVFFLFFTSQVYDTLIERNTTLLWVGLVILGSLASAAGRATFNHLSIELPGLILYAGGMLVYGLLQLFSMNEQNSLTRIGLLLLIVVIAHPQIERLTFLIHKFAVAMGWQKDGVWLRRRKKVEP